MLLYMILMAELEEKLPKSWWPTYGRNFLISNSSKKIFGMNLQEALVDMGIEFFWQNLTYILSYIPLSNR